MAGNRASPDRLLLRVSEAAEMCGISRAHFYALLQRGEIPSVAIGRSRRVPVAWLTAWVERQTADWEAARGGGRGEQS
jgi:excisionase family DNA binding protein